MTVLDFRSDTVTRPTAAMRETMANAEVGDDVYGDDPTVNRLQARAAELLGTEAALFVPSGTMGNQVCIRTQTRHGDVVLAGEGAHVLLYEAGGAAALAGVQIQTIGSGGFFGADDVAAAIHPDEQHHAPTTLVAVENTHNTSGGRVFPLEELRAVAAVARERGLALHLDGARLFNAVVATGVPARDWAAACDTVTFCLSKGLEALDVELVARPETNMVYFRIDDVMGFLRETRARDLWINPIGPRVFRAVTHLDVDAGDVEDALGRTAEALKALRD